MCSMSLTVVQRRDASCHLVRRQAGVLERDGDHRHFDVGEDIGRRTHRCERSDDEERKRQHHEGVRPPQRGVDKS
jgi:hypothetical protein